MDIPLALSVSSGLAQGDQGVYGPSSSETCLGGELSPTPSGHRSLVTGAARRTDRRPYCGSPHCCRQDDQTGSVSLSALSCRRDCRLHGTCRRVCPLEKDPCFQGSLVRFAEDARVEVATWYIHSMSSSVSCCTVGTTISGLPLLLNQYTNPQVARTSSRP